MRVYVLRRVLAGVPVVLIVAVIVFVLTRIVPGDVARTILGREATLDQVQELRASLGIDKPIPVQFGLWLGGLVRGDLGESYISQEPVTSEIAKRIGPTVSITVLTELVVILVALPLGILAAWRANSLFDRAVMVFAAVGFSMPVFWMGFNLIWVFGVWGFGTDTALLPVFGYEPLSAGLISYLKHLILPVAALGFTAVALLTRITRASTIEIVSQDYIRTARAKGLSDNRVLIVHTARNAALPVATVIGLQVAYLLTGVVVTETVFAVPGIGRLGVNAMQERDFPLIQGIIMLAAFSFVVVNLLVDIGYAYLDPRIRY